MPTTHPDTWGWEKQKQEVENEIKLALETMLLSVPGLEAAWQKHTEIEKLKTLRADILQNASTLLAQQPAGGAASSSTTSQAPGERSRHLPAQSPPLAPPGVRHCAIGCSLSVLCTSRLPAGPVLKWLRGTRPGLPSQIAA